MVNLGNLLADQLDPPELEEARGWYLKAATPATGREMVNLGYLLADQLDPPELEEARGWYLKAADAGNTPGNEQPRLPAGQPTGSAGAGGRPAAGT